MEQPYKPVYQKRKYELYDIIRDPSEKNDLAEKHPAEVERLKKMLDEEITKYRRSFEGDEYGTASVNRMNQQWRNMKVTKK